MAFESIVCPECRATQGFTQVEVNTYYCSYHKGLFTWVDPRQVTVVQVASSCSCGNRVEFQCQLCKQGLCADCDAVEAQKRIITRAGPHASEWELSKNVLGSVLVSMRGFGYLEYVHPPTIWSITGNRVTTVDVGEGVLGPYLSLGDILPQLAKDPVGLRHVCCACVLGGIPSTAEAIASGRECERPACGAPPSGDCRCCGGAFCSRHLKGNVSEFLGRSGLRYGDSKRFRLPSQAGFCLICGDECMVAALEAIEKMLLANPWARVIGMERKVCSLLDDFDQTPRPCRRGQFFAERVTRFRVPIAFGPVHGPTYDAPASYDFALWTYQVLDQRDQVSPAPA
jgi:hypothetical protein